MKEIPVSKNQLSGNLTVYQWSSDDYGNES